MAKIMIVDNEVMITDLVKEILEKAGHRVTVANSGKQCIDTLNKGNIDLVLLDIMMPDMSGWEVFQKIKGKSKVAFISVVEISKERKDTLTKEGLSGFISKPFTAKDLVAKVKSIVG